MEQPSDNLKTDEKPSYMPNFKLACVCIGLLNIILAGSLFIKGFPESMEPFQVPSLVLHSPHYLDALQWVYTHMIVIGLVIIVVGLYAESIRLKVAFSRLMFIAHVYYVYLDFRSSDSFLGNGLYKGNESLIPVFIGLFFMFCFFYYGFFHFKNQRDNNP